MGRTELLTEWEGHRASVKRCSLAIFVTRVAIVLHDVLMPYLKLKNGCLHNGQQRAFCGLDLHVLDFYFNFLVIDVKSVSGSQLTGGVRVTIMPVREVFSDMKLTCTWLT